MSYVYIPLAHSDSSCSGRVSEQDSSHAQGAPHLVFSQRMEESSLTTLYPPEADTAYWAFQKLLADPSRPGECPENKEEFIEN